MKAIIDGKRYDTETARDLCRIPCPHFRGDFGWHETRLYLTPNGAYFLAGRGGAASMWGKSDGNNGSGPGAGIRPVDPAEARYYLEAAEEWDVIEELFDVEDA